MANWVKIEETNDGATFLNLEGAVRFDFRAYRSTDGGRVRVYYNGTDIEVSSDRDAEAFNKIMEFLNKTVGYTAPARSREDNVQSENER